MDYEKKYKEAIELMKDCIPDADGLVHVRPQEIFPELKESEDEKTKRILHSISSKISFHLRDIFTEEEFQCFDAWSNAWLEKQGEQNLAWSEEDIMRIDNLISIIENRGYPDYVEYLEKLKYRVQPKQEWSEEDEMMIKFALTHFRKAGATEDSDILKWIKFLKYRIQPKQEWSEEDEQTFIKSVEALEDFGKLELADWLKEHKGGIKL